MTQYRAITRRKLIGLMGGLAGGLALHGCQAPASNSTAGESSGSATEDRETITVGVVPWIGYAPLYVAEAKGFFDGITVESKTFSSNGDNLASFASGNLTAQAATNPEVVAQAARNIDYRIVMMADSSLGGDGILARSSIADIADFKGQKVGVEIGSTSYYFLLQVLKENGLTIDDIEAVNITADASAAAYQAGTIDIAVTYQPFLASANEAQPDGRTIIDTAALPTAILDVYLFQADFVENNPEKVQAFVNGILQARAFIESSGEEAAEIIGDKLEVDPSEVAAQLGDVDLTSLEDNQKILTGEGASQSLAENLVTLSDFLVAQDEIEAPLAIEEVEKLIDPSFVQAATLPAAE